MVFRVYSERKSEFSLEAESLKNDLVTLHGIKGLKRVRILRRYDVENVSEETFMNCVDSVFYDPRTEESLFELPADADRVFAAEYLPGQYDQCADAAEQCIKLIALGGGEGAEPKVRTARVYLVYGDISDADLKEIKASLINPVDSREGEIEKPESLAQKYDEPDTVEFIHGFTALDDEGLKKLIADMGLAMDLADASAAGIISGKRAGTPPLRR